MKKILVVSGIPYSETNRGIDTITSYFIEKNYEVSHLVFGVNSLKKIIKIKKVKIDKFQQLFSKSSYFSYLGIMGKYFPNFLLKYIIKKTNKTVNFISFEVFDLIVLEIGKPLFLLDVIPKDIPLIIRLSDSIEMAFGCKRKFFEMLENKAISRSRIVLVVNDEMKKKYKQIDKVLIWENGFNRNPQDSFFYDNNEKLIIYMGLAKIDYELINFLAKENNDLKFYIIGPHKRKKLNENIIFKGYLSEKEYMEIFRKSLCLLLPYNKKTVSRLKEGNLTSKIYIAMDLGKPILTVQYGTLNEDNEKINLFTFKNYEEANQKLKNIIKNKFTRTKEIDEILNKLELKNRKKELEKFLKEFKLIN